MKQSRARPPQAGWNTWPRGFTPREREVALLLDAGMSNKEIARRLDLSVGTVKLHVHNILDKSGARSRYAFVAHEAARRNSESQLYCQEAVLASNPNDAAHDKLEKGTQSAGQLATAVSEPDFVPAK